MPDDVRTDGLGDRRRVVVGAVIGDHDHPDRGELPDRPNRVSDSLLFVEGGNDHCHPRRRVVGLGCWHRFTLPQPFLSKIIHCGA
jgi:hypothetical protein